MSRYEVDCSETQYQKGSHGTVMENKLGIIDSQEMYDVETVLLAQLYEKIFINDDPEPNKLLFDNITAWHRQWLGNIYEWAGKVRSVSMGKGGFQFTSPLQLAKCIDIFESRYLSSYPYIPEMNKKELVAYLAHSHVEFILIHPFREGNGRMSRLLMDSMCNKAGLGLLDYSLWEKHKAFYIASIHAGVSHDYQHMERLVSDILQS